MSQVAKRLYLLNSEKSQLDRIIRKVRRRVAAFLSHMASVVRPSEPSGLDLRGSRDVEWSWVLSHLGTGPGKVLDLGPGPFPLLSLTAAQRGYDVLALDRQPFDWTFVPARVSLRQGDILAEEFSAETFDLIINCSTIEHVGLAGRYDAVKSFPDGDLVTMTMLLKGTKSGGLMLLTVPVGLDAVFAPLHRVYGERRLPLLLNGWTTKEEGYWMKQGNGCWEAARRQHALSRPGSERHFGLGCFVLTK